MGEVKFGLRPKS